MSRPFVAGEAPSRARVGVAGLAAAAAAPVPLAVGMLVGVAGGGELAAILLLPLIMLVGLPIALLHVVLLGLPLYLALRRRWRIGWPFSTLAGAVIGSLPMALLWDPASALVVGGLGGLAGGFAFWWVLRGADGEPPARYDDPERIFG
jgi:hypothetical protein